MDTQEMFVVLKPSTAEAVDGNIYEVSRKVFTPTPESAKTLINLLNTMDLNRSTKVEYLEGKRPKGLKLQAGFEISLEQAEKIAVDLNCNVIGGIFLMYLNRFGVDIGDALGRSQIMHGDREFTLALYSSPVTIQYFEDPSKLSDFDRNLMDSVLYNNTGQFLSIEVGDLVDTKLADSMAKIAFLKRVFRHTADQTIKWTESKYLRDNMVHSPDRLEEVKSHREALAQRFIEQ